jgi:uncharacterized protein YbjT (DUF2867 family)
MKITVAGAHGQIGLRLCGLLSQRGDEVLGIVRNPDHGEELSATGALPVVCDLETASTRDIGEAVGDAGVVVFAAGSGAGSGPERKLAMDRDGAIALLQASAPARYVMVSAVGAEAPPDDDEVFSVYLRAKAQADNAVLASGRQWSILRPGRLTDEPGSGCVRLSREPFRSEITRDDVAQVLVGLIDGAGTGAILYAGAGDTPVAQALADASR